MNDHAGWMTRSFGTFCIACGESDANRPCQMHAMPIKVDRFAASEQFSFDWALRLLKIGKRVRRSGWNGNKKPNHHKPAGRAPEIRGGLVWILLHNGNVAVCDEADYSIVSAQTNWVDRRGYAAFTKYGEGKAKSVTMHGLLNPDWKMTDHINGDRLDNRRCNLRECTAKQNIANSKGRVGTSKFKGVSWDSSREVWISSIQHDGKTEHIGRFDDENEAAEAYDLRAKELHGEFARLNFPSEEDVGGMWIKLEDGKSITLEAAISESAASLRAEEVMRQVPPPVMVDGVRGYVNTCARIDMRAADGSIVIGWLASQTDLLASDWELVP